jgi:quercetin dioxygenase-like cupin family protein
MTALDTGSPSVSRRGVLVGASATTLLTALLSRNVAQTDAQEATPAIASGGQGVTAEVLGAGQPSTASGMELSLRRITIAPGGGLAPHTHPGTLVIYVESGTWGHTSIGGTAQLTRGTVEGTPQPAEEVERGVS